MSGTGETQEFIADSEDESMLVDPPLNAIGRVVDKSTELDARLSKHTSGAPSLSQPPIAVLPVAPTSSSSSAAGPSVPQRDGKEATSSISSPSEPGNADSAKPRPKPRPRPRPAYKGANAANPSTSTSSSANTSHISTFTDLSIPRPPQPDSITEWSSVPAQVTKVNDTHQTDISTFSSDISERAKMRALERAVKAPQAKPKPSINVIDTIELTSDSDDELSLLPSARSAKGKTAPVKAATGSRHSPKRPRLTDESEAPGSTLATIPVATLDTTLLSSQLPPSDFPVPSSSVPPTSTPGPPESPLSSPIPRVPSRKRKKMDVVNTDDELDAHTVEKDSQKLMPPPPLPLATSSITRRPPASHPTTLDTVEAGPSNIRPEGSKAKPKGRKKKAIEDDEEDDWMEDPKPKPKPKGRKKAVDDDEDEDWGAPAKPKPAKKSQRKKKQDAEQKETITTVEMARLKENVVEVVVAPRKSRSPRKSPTAAGDVFVEPTEETIQDIPEPDPEPPVTSSSKAKGKGKAKAKATKRAVVLSDDEDVDSVPAPSKGKGRANRKKIDSPAPSIRSNSPPEPHASPPLVRKGSLKENDGLGGPSSSPDVTAAVTPSRPPSSSALGARSVSRASSVIPRTNTPMSELIRRVNSKPGSPFASPRSTYSPYAKSSKNMLKRIAPLHPNRRTPPPPPPRPPPPKKTKKELAMEEQWEMELEESVEGWYAMTEEERAVLRRAKRDAALGVDD